jgi:hypothetical protein
MVASVLMVVIGICGLITFAIRVRRDNWSPWLTVATIIAVIIFGLNNSLLWGQLPVKVPRKIGLSSAETEVATFLIRAFVNILLFAMFSWSFHRYSIDYTPHVRKGAWKSVVTALTVVTILAIGCSLRLSVVSDRAGGLYDVLMALVGSFIATLAAGARASRDQQLA